MEGFLNRYRNITVLLLVILVQLLLLGFQVKNAQDVRIIRVWTVTAVTPVARILEAFRGGTTGLVRNYVLLHEASSENRRLRDENGRLKLDNTFLKNELSRADRAKALEIFQAHTPSKMVAATIIMTAAGSNSKVLFVDRGSSSGVMRGMAVVTPDGIVGIVNAAYPVSSEVLLITDADFAAGVITQKSQARGTLKGDGTPMCKIDYVPPEEKVEPGEWVYTSGDDRVFPRGFPVGVVKAVRPGSPFKEILVQPSGLQHGLEDVLILVNVVHQDVPEVQTPAPTQPVYIAPPPNANPGVTGSTGGTGVVSGGAPGTEADKLRTVYKSLGEAQGHTYGVGEVGSRPPDFTKLPVPGSSTPNAPAASGPRAPAAATGSRAPAQGGVESGAPASTGARTPGAPASTGARAPGASGSTGIRTGVPAATGPRAPSGPRAATGPRDPAALPKADPAKKSAPGDAPNATERPADAARRLNQAAGAPKGPSQE